MNPALISINDRASDTDRRKSHHEHVAQPSLENWTSHALKLGIVKRLRWLGTVDERKPGGSSVDTTETGHIWQQNLRSPHNAEWPEQ